MAFCATDGNVRCFENEQKRKIAQNVQRRYGRLLGLESVDVQQNQKLTITEAGGISAAVLTAIAIPVFTTQLEKSREATDASNVRAYYAEIATALLAGDLDAPNSTTTVGSNITATCAAGASSASAANATFTVTMPYTPVQHTTGWQGGAPNVGGVTLADWTVSTTATAGTLTFTFTLGADLDPYLSGVTFA